MMEMKTEYYRIVNLGGEHVICKADSNFNPLTDANGNYKIVRHMIKEKKKGYDSYSGVKNKNGLSSNSNVTYVIPDVNNIVKDEKMFWNFDKRYDRILKILNETAAFSYRGGETEPYEEAFYVQIYGSTPGYMCIYDFETDNFVDIMQPIDYTSRGKNLKKISILGKETLDLIRNYIRIGPGRYCIPFYKGLMFAETETQYSKETNTDDYVIRRIHILCDREYDSYAIVKHVKDRLYKKIVNLENKTNFEFISVNGASYDTFSMDINDKEIDIKANYNDDLPYEQFNQLIQSDKHELILLYGKPGTGKTTLIRKLMKDNENKLFKVIDADLVSSLSDSRLINFLMHNQGCVFVIEDCEKLIASRKSGNRGIASMLNLTDGLIGEALNQKFICTFNCDVSKIDEALMRKGRLSKMYEFKKLSLEKTKALRPEATKEMTLAEIYYYEEDNNAEINDTKIGFVK